MASPACALRLIRTTRRKEAPPQTRHFQQYKPTDETLLQELKSLGGDPAMKELQDWTIRDVRQTGHRRSPKPTTLEQPSRVTVIWAAAALGATLGGTLPSRVKPKTSSNSSANSVTAAELTRPPTTRSERRIRCRNSVAGGSDTPRANRSPRAGSYRASAVLRARWSAGRNRIPLRLNDSSGS